MLASFKTTSAPNDLVRATNGIDVSHWNGSPKTQTSEVPRLVGIKATHIGGKRTVDGLDPMFGANRATWRATSGVEWRAFYHYLTSSPSPAEQMALFVSKVRDLAEGECVYLDWEADGVTPEMVDECVHLLWVTYGGRYLVYANDNNPASASWLDHNRAIPRWFPDYGPEGLVKAKEWGATVWQSGAALTPWYPADVPIDLVLDPATMDRLCGRE